METGCLICPLCCDEKFENRESLKNHLLSVAENIRCPICKDSFDSIATLAAHLEEDCVVGLNGVNIKLEGSDKRLEEILVNESILAKALLRREEKEGKSGKGGGDLSLTVAVEEENGEEDEDLFYCSSCEINFTSIDEHLEKFHVGHEVLIQDDEEVASKAALASNNDEESQDQDMYLTEQERLFEDDIGTESDDEEEAKFNKEFPQILDTVQQQECLDKDGRLYTRKVVKIEKFWEENSDENMTKKEPPLVEKYIIVNGKAVKNNEDNHDEADNQNCIDLYRCMNCKVQFSKLSGYYKHTCSPRSSKPKQYKCSKCPAYFSNARSLCAHMKAHKDDKDSPSATSPHSGPYICVECNTDFPSYKSMRLHKRMHDPVKSREIEAPVSYGITGATDEEVHQQTESMREMFVCEICNKTYDKQYEDAHMSFHKEEDSFDCYTCNRKFYTKANLDMHMRAHSTGKKFTCSYCKKAFLTFENLQEHVTNQCQKRRYECQYCGRRFSRPHEKVKHERIHTGEKPHVCQICGKAFRVSYCLTLHMRTHSGTRPYQCSYCNKRFKAHSVFNHHLLTHSDVRAYKCPYCPKAFKTGVQLAGHKNSHIKPFTCTECNRPFASLYAVRAHMETHKRENNLKFSCWMCGASYARAFALRDHIKDHHGEEHAEAAATLVAQDDEVLIQLDTETVEEMDSMVGVESSVEAMNAVEEMEVINIAAVAAE